MAWDGAPRHQVVPNHPHPDADKRAPSTKIRPGGAEPGQPPGREGSPSSETANTSTGPIPQEGWGLIPPADLGEVGRGVWPSPPSTPAHQQMKGRPAGSGHLGTIPFLLNREKTEGLHAGQTLPCSLGTGVSITDTQQQRTFDRTRIQFTAARVFYSVLRGG